MTELRVMVGIPGSGKSSYIKRESDRLTSQGQKVRVISRDAIRFSLVGENDEYFSKEKQVFEKFITSINSAVLSNTFDVIFCRNVLIYFKVEDQEKILNRLFSYLKIGGTLYLGHSESILGLAYKVDRLGQNIFVKVME